MKNNRNQQNRNQEFASETDIQKVKEQNRQAELKKQQASGAQANRSSNRTK
ncbi:small, acid-soluble spore protein, gamma-type [Paenisporosarcina quisquiliarum]|uniref:Small, acid-soluble spore protein gamma-type n=1 Tax=Psychrobacillus psychrodurans TaxID=126157 RepID=A0A9X3RBF1_9BACI|nr:gamma-type small acid-soluble spore protein [Psychrobacillus psychrodurans]SEN48251.1 small, acid-soluble spore protein, gamma-type [Paenisporosarcina quisquiliarum]MCK1997674.1 gamma-type small acid-soluble spore protein [Psychrobacillus psychrodurans]MCZ8534153.1 gamma-type small acid-soluble spore protein [Psychrobacillus psychrodurans]MCZ8540638.1 gamma-type small acid-soluble spore protein [Psychrobacillus psychrodurans]SFM65819.1 small acid-soluble spore protein E (minor gamma-type SA